MKLDHQNGKCRSNDPADDPDDELGRCKDDPSEKKQANLHQWPCQRFKNTLEKNLCFLED